MADKQIIKTVYGKYHKYEMFKSADGLISNKLFLIYRNGAYWKGVHNP